MQGDWFLAADIGGTKTRLAAIARDEAGGWRLAGEPLVLDTPSDPKELREPVASIVEEARGAPAGMIGGVAGRLAGGRRELVFAPRLSEAWKGASLQALANEWVGEETPSWWFNDTVLVGLGEVYFGAGTPTGIVAYVTISTGVGGCRFVDGAPDAHEGSFEPGHMVVDAARALCPECAPCPLDGEVDWEAMVSGTALSRRFGVPPYRIAQDDPVWQQLAEWCGVALRNLAVVWTPHRVVLGGSMVVGDPAIPLAPIRKALGEHPLTRGVELSKAQLGALGGIYGAMRVAEEVVAARG